jgi:site-specific DNA recombinase
MLDHQIQHLTVALYCRVSTEEQREGQTIDSQIAELERFVRDKQWTVIGVYKDEGWSGSLLARPALDQLRDHAGQGRFKAVLVNDVDRLARDVSHLGILKRDLESRNVSVIFRKLPGEQSPTHNLLVNILGSFAEFERELIADRTRRGRRHKVEVRKQHVGSIPPYGFKYIVKRSSDGEPGHLEILAAEAAIVRSMYGWVDQDGLSAQKVVTRLNAIGVRPRKGGQRWQKSSVLRILRSEVYSGVWHYNKHLHCIPLRPPTDKYRKLLRSSARLRPRADWIPVQLSEELRIVDPASWRRVQQQLDRNVAMSPRNSKHAYLLRGLVRCGGCQGAYVGDPDSYGYSYRCANRCKRYQSIREGSLDGTVWNAVKQSLKAPEILAAGINSVHRNNRDHLATDRDNDQRALDQIRMEESRILEAYRLGFLAADQLGAELKGLKARTSLVESQITERQETADISTTRRSLADFCKLASERLDTANWENKRQLLLQLVTKITFEGEVVRISGRISLPPDTESIATSNLNNPNGGRCVGAGVSPEMDDAKNSLEAESRWKENEIASTTPRYRGRNPDRIADTTSYRSVRNTSPWGNEFFTEEGSGFTALFELVSPVDKDLSAKRTAAISNLAKANAARWKHRTKVSPRQIAP